MSGCYRVEYELVGRGALVVVGVDEYEGWERELGEGSLWCQQQFGVPGKLVKVERTAEDWIHHEALSVSGVRLCWFCLAPALAVCYVCGENCCGEHAYTMRAEVRHLLRVPTEELAIECVSCVCK